MRSWRNLAITEFGQGQKKPSQEGGGFSGSFCGKSCGKAESLSGQGSFLLL